MPDLLIRPGKIARWGNGAAVRIGTAALERAGLHVDDAVEVVAGEDEIVIRRQRPRVTMAELLARFDPAKHRHDLAFDGDPAGSETQ
jgi:antitoxin component of MazEF toxin-antitoxin module